MNIDLSISLGNILTILSFIGGGIMFVMTIKAHVEAIGQRVGGLERHIDKIADIMLVQGVQQERMNGIDSRLNGLSGQLDRQSRKLDEAVDKANRDS